MKVLHIVAGNRYGGVETLLVTLARMRDHYGKMQPYYALCFEGRLSKELRETGVAVYKFSETRISKPWTVLTARKQLRDLLEKEKFDVVICHSCWPLAVFGPVVRNNKISLVLCAHNIMTGKGWLEFWAGKISPDLIICNSEYTKAGMSKFFQSVTKKAFYYPISIPNVKDRAFLRNGVRNKLGTDPGSVVIIQASRLEQWKGPGVLISALAKLKDLKNWTCWFCAGPQSPKETRYLVTLQSTARQLGIADRILFLGERTDMPNILYSGDIYCQPNTGPEPFGIAFIEAMYAGLPVVATAIGGALEIVDNTSGILVRPNDAVALADALRMLIANNEQRKRYALNSYNRAAALCEPAARINELYSALLTVAPK